MSCGAGVQTSLCLNRLRHGTFPEQLRHVPWRNPRPPSLCQLDTKEGSPSKKSSPCNRIWKHIVRAIGFKGYASMLLYVSLCLYALLLLYDTILSFLLVDYCGGRWRVDPMAQWVTGHGVFCIFLDFLQILHVYENSMACISIRPSSFQGLQGQTRARK